MVCLNGQGLGRSAIRKLVTRNFGGKVMWQKYRKIFMSSVNAHQRVTSAEEGFTHLVGMMTHSVPINWLLCTVTPGIAHWVHGQSGPGGQGWRSCMCSAT